jgi:ATP-dependent protease ClpP protease subunit
MEKKRPSKKRRSETPEIALIGELFEEAEGDVVNALLDVPTGGRVTLFIDCPGGSVYAAMAIVALIRFRKLKVSAVVIGECSSSALLVFACCEKRLVTPRSVFLFHRVKWRSEKEVRSEEAAQWAEHFQWLEKEVDQYQAEMFGRPHEKFAEWIEQSRFVTGREMAELGLAEMVER